MNNVGNTLQSTFSTPKISSPRVCHKLLLADVNTVTVNLEPKNLLIVASNISTELLTRGLNLRVKKNLN